MEARREVARIAGEAALWLSERLYVVGWAAHHRAAQIEDWGFKTRARSQELKTRGAESPRLPDHPDQGEAMDDEGYFDRAGNPINRDQAVELFENAERRRVANTVIADAHKPGTIEVSTVHLVRDHSFGFGPPVLFETMAFATDQDGEVDWSGLDGYTRRYHTEDEAIAGHLEVVAEVMKDQSDD
jgi:hypothetical protein